MEIGAGKELGRRCFKDCWVDGVRGVDKDSGADSSSGSMKFAGTPPPRPEPGHKDL